MHILALIIGLIGAASLWYWRFQRARDLADAAADMAGTVKNLPRRLKFLKKSHTEGLALLDDPRDSATALMIEVARADGPVSASAYDAIMANLTGALGLEERDAEERLVGLQWLLDGVPQGPKVVTTLTRQLLRAETISDDDRQDLAGLLGKVAEADGGITPIQRDIIAAYTDRVIQP